MAGAVCHKLEKPDFESKCSNDLWASDCCHWQLLPKTFDAAGIEVASAHAPKNSYVYSWDAQLHGAAKDDGSVT